MRAMILFAVLLMVSCRDITNQKIDSSAGFLNVHLLSYKEEFGEYPRDIKAFTKSRAFLERYPENRISSLYKLIDSKDFDYGGSDPLKNYLFRYKLDNQVRSFPKLEGIEDGPKE